MATPTSPTIPTRSNTTGSDEGVSGTGEDTSEATRLFQERLQAWKHACGYMEDYIGATEKMLHSQVKEYEKIFKHINQPLREQNHFSQQQGGVGTMFDTIRGNTTAIANAYGETAKNLSDVVLPIFQRLHQEIKDKAKEVSKGVGKSTKAVDKARANTQSHVELLGSHTAIYGTGGMGAKPDPSKDPYIIQKGVYYRLNRQIQEENATRQDMLAVQDNFAQMEMHIIDVFQQGMNQFYNATAGQCDRIKALYGVMTENTDSIDPLFEWNGFVSRNDNILIDKMAPPRSLANVSFPNQDHASTKPLCQGVLERKSGLIKKLESSFYVVTPAKFLHQFHSEDNTAKDPSPDLSLYLPDCIVGPQVNGHVFSVRGKDVSKGKLGGALARESDYTFTAPSDKDAETWWTIVRQVAGSQSGQIASPTSPTSPQSPQSPQSAEKVAPAAAAAPAGTEAAAASPTDHGKTATVDHAAATGAPEKRPTGPPPGTTVPVRQASVPVATTTTTTTSPVEKKQEFA